MYYTIGVSVSSLHRESTDSLIYIYYAQERCHSRKVSYQQVTQLQVHIFVSLIKKTNEVFLFSFQMHIQNIIYE